MKVVAIGTVFVLVALAAGSTIPTAFADHGEVVITHAVDSGIPGCEETDEGCFQPKVATVDVGGKVIFKNDDNVGHTATSGVPADNELGTVFDSGLALPGDVYEWTPTEIGEYPYLCIVHPWMGGLIIVQEAGAELEIGTKTPAKHITAQSSTSNGSLEIDSDVYVTYIHESIWITVSGTSQKSIHQSVFITITFPDSSEKKFEIQTTAKGYFQVPINLDINEQFGTYNISAVGKTGSSLGNISFKVREKTPVEIPVERLVERPAERTFVPSLTGLSGEVKIGILLPVIGDLSTHGTEGKVAIDLAVMEFNEYLDEQGAQWDLKAVFEDSATNPAIALEKLQAFNAKGINVIVGPQSSGEVRNIKGYADSNGMILISPSSTAPALAIEGDNVFRLIPDDTKQALAIKELMITRDISTVVPIWRGDAWGDGLHDKTKEGFEARGGVFDNGIRYNPETAEFFTEASILADKVQSYIDEGKDASEIGVFVISFAEIVPIMQSASQYDVLSNVKWFGSDGNTKEQQLIDDPIGRAFSESVMFETTQVAASDNEIYKNVEDYVVEQMGRTPNAYAYSSYDGVWLAGLTIMDVRTTDVDMVKLALPYVAAEYTGAIGKTVLNDAGDLAGADYEIWTTEGGEWIKVARYVAETGEIEDSALMAMDDSMTSKLEGEIAIGLLLPLTGDLSSHGEENAEGSILGVADFNAYLEEWGERWSLKVVSEDTATSPAIALEKAQALKARGVDIVIGPEASSNVRSIMGYANANDMLLISCCSTAPALAIADDNVFRLVPDDTKQGVAIGKILESDGIQHIVPVWRGDTWGDGLSAETIKSFAERGGSASDGIRYNPEAPEFSVSSAALADSVREAIDTHGTDNVGVLYIGFKEVLPFMQAAASHDILDDVKWYGADGNTKEHALIDDPLASEFSSTVMFTTVQISDSDTPLYTKVQDHVLDTLGRVPSTFVHTSYDAAQIIGLSMLKAQSADIHDVKAVLPEVTRDYVGAAGDLRLNEAGDLESADYGIWGIRDGQWVPIGTWLHSTDEIEYSTSMAATGLSGEVEIGILLPVIGDLSTHGTEGKVAIDLAVMEFNEYLDEQGAQWDLKAVFEDSATNPAIALEKLQAFNAKGINVIVGPQSSSEVRNIKGYADSNGMILISPSSTAPALAIAGDNVFRLIPDDTKQAPAIKELMISRDISTVVPIWRADAWGDGLHEKTKESFEAEGGMFDEGVRYNPETAEFSTEASILADKVQSYIDEGKDASEIGVFVISFAEILPIMQSASQYDVLNNVKWFGSDGNAREQQLIDNPIGRDFSQKVMFETIQVAASNNEIYKNVEDYVLEQMGRTPNAYAYSSYDGVWLAGPHHNGGADHRCGQVKLALPDVAAGYTGAIGKTVLNDAGDLAGADYEIWTIMDGEWVITGIYLTADRTISNGNANSIRFGSETLASKDRYVPLEAYEKHKASYNDHADKVTGAIVRAIYGDTISADGIHIQLSLLDIPERYEDGHSRAISFMRQQCHVGSVIVYDTDDGQQSNLPNTLAARCGALMADRLICLLINCWWRKDMQRYPHIFVMSANSAVTAGLVKMGVRRMVYSTS